MITKKQSRETRMIELAETHNIYLSISRIKNAAGNDFEGRRWKRALYHALGLAFASNSELEKVRIALGLP